MRTDSKITIIFALVVAIVLLGEIYVYAFNTDGYSSDASVSGNRVDYSVSADVSTTYSVHILDNGSFKPNAEYYIYYDSGYGSSIEAVPVPVGAKPFTQDYYISQLIHMFEYRGITNVETLDASELREAMLSDIYAGTCEKGLIVLSGALPDTIYKGVDTDTIFEWLGDGGRLYWAGNLLGRYVASADGGLTDLDENGVGYQTMFFGTDCLNTGDADKAYSDITVNDYRHTMSMANNSVKYGVDASKLPAGDVLAMGYTDGTYSSTAFVKYWSGDGMICVVGGDYSSYQRNDFAQMISSGLSYCSETIGYAEGALKRTTLHGTIDATITGGNVILAYVYYGGYYPIYGKLMELTA